MSRNTAYMMQMAITITVNICSTTYGTWIAWPSAIIKPLLNGDLGYTATKSQISTMIGLLDIGNLITPIPTSYLINIMGRKSLVHWTSLVFVMASVFAIISTNIWHLYVARFLAGLARGVIFSSLPLFGAEIAGLNIRGAIGVVPSTMLAGGSTLSYLLGIMLPFKLYNIVLLALPVGLGVACFFVPETMYFLTMKKKDDKALKNLKFYRCTSKDDKVREEFELIKETVNKDMENRARFVDVISTKGRRRALLIVCLTVFFQRAAGIIPLLSYATLVLPETGGGLSREVYAVINSIVLVIAHILGMVLVETWGRKRLLIVSSVVCAITTAVFAVFYHTRHIGLDVAQYNWVPYACLLNYSMSWGSGMCAVPLVLVGELFSMDVKSYAGCIATLVYALSNFVIIKVFGELEANYGIEYAFYIFSFMCVVCIFYTKKFVFETKGKTFLEIQAILNDECVDKTTSDVSNKVLDSVETIK